MRYIIRCYIPADVEEPETYDIDEAIKVYFQLSMMQPENIYSIDEYEDD